MAVLMSWSPTSLPDTKSAKLGEIQILVGLQC